MSVLSSARRRTRIVPGPCAAAGLLALALAACAPTNRVVGPPDPTYAQVHPIVLNHGSRSIDIFLAGGSGHIGARQMADVRAFAAEYRRSGEGPLLIGFPTTDPTARRAGQGIREALASAGVTSARTGSYRPDDPEAIAPVKLAFTRLQAQVEGPCGQWPDDIAEYNGTLSGWNNRAQPWENFGCATQNALAKQVADPLDLVRARPEGPSSAVRRVTVMSKYGQGQATATIYPDEGKEKINTGVGQ